MRRSTFILRVNVFVCSFLACNSHHMKEDSQDLPELFPGVSVSCCANNVPVMQSLLALGDCERVPMQIGTVQGLRGQSQGAGLQLSCDSLIEPPDDSGLESWIMSLSIPC